MTAVFTITFVPLAPLFKRYNPESRQFDPVGVRDGVYGREDENGRTYMVEAEYRKGLLTHSTSYECGVFYPDTVVISGEDDNNASLPHVTLQTVMRKLNSTHEMEDIILPRGLARGKNTWREAVRSVRGAEWWGMLRLQGAAKKLTSLPGVEIISPSRSLYLCADVADLEQFITSKP